MSFAPKKPLSPQAARIKAEEMCARAEHSSGEILEKLKKWGIGASDAAAIVAALKKARYIDDKRFACAYARDKMEYSHWGRRKIALGLYTKRISRELIDLALDSLDTERYQEALRSVVAAKRRSLPDPDTYDGRTKIFRHAASRGFEPDLIIQAIKGVQAR